MNHINPHPLRDSCPQPQCRHPQQPQDVRMANCYALGSAVGVASHPGDVIFGNKPTSGSV
jgi:hypothetical protein